MQLRGLYCSNGELAWDKVSERFCIHHVNLSYSPQDEADHLDFVVAAANLRAFAFNITRKSRFDIKCEFGYCLGIETEPSASS